MNPPPGGKSAGLGAPGVDSTSGSDCEGRRLRRYEGRGSQWRGRDAPRRTGRWGAGPRQHLHTPQLRHSCLSLQLPVSPQATQTHSRRFSGAKLLRRGLWYGLGFGQPLCELLSHVWLRRWLGLSVRPHGFRPWPILTTPSHSSVGAAPRDGPGARPPPPRASASLVAWRGRRPCGRGNKRAPAPLSGPAVPSGLAASSNGGGAAGRTRAKCAGAGPDRGAVRARRLNRRPNTECNPTHKTHKTHRSGDVPLSEYTESHAS